MGIWLICNGSYFILCTVGTFTITKVAPTDEGEASKVKIKVRINIHGVFYVKDATMVEKQKVVETPPEAMETESLPTDVQLPDVEKMAAGEPAVVPDGGEATDMEGGKAEKEQQQQQATEKMEGTNSDAGSESTASTDTPPEAKVVSD